MTDRFTADLSASLSQAFGESAFLAERRAEAFARFESLPWPDGSIERWRHTDIRALDLATFDPERSSKCKSDVPEGVTQMCLADAARENEELVRSWLGAGGIPDSEEKFHALNAAFGSGTFVHVPRGVAVSEPVVAGFTAGRGAALLPRTVIVVEEGASLTYIHRYSGGSDSLAVPVVEIYAEQGAQVNYLSVQDWDQSVWHFGVERAVIGRDATLRTLNANLGGKVARTVSEVALDGQGASAEMFGVYFGDHDQHIDNRTLQLHRAPNTTSNLLYKGALKGSSRAIYSGLVDIEKEATGADARQANRNLLLSEHASADPSPFLEIKTSEVVRATHGVSIGRPDPEVLFYLGTRGLDEQTATNLFVKGFFQEVIDQVHVAGIRAQLEGAVEAELALED